jgi:hypothetical protein
MAYNDKYYGLIKDYTGTTYYRVAIKELDYTGTSEQINHLAPTPLVISNRGGRQVEEEGTTIIGSDVQFNFYVTSGDSNKYDEIFESEELDYQLEIATQELVVTGETYINGVDPEDTLDYDAPDDGNGTGGAGGGHNWDEVTDLERLALILEVDKYFTGNTVYSFIGSSMNGLLNVDTTITGTSTSTVVTGTSTFDATPIVINVTKGNNGGIAQATTIINWYRQDNPPLSAISHLEADVFYYGDPINSTYTYSGNSVGARFKIDVIEGPDYTTMQFEQYSDFAIGYTWPFFKYTFPTTNNITINGNASGTTNDNYVSTFPLKVTKMTGYSPTGVTTTAEGELEIIWWKNAIAIHTENFVSGDTIDVSFSYTGLVPSDILLVTVEELTPAPLADYTIYSELMEAVPGIQNWEAHFDSDVHNLVGSMSAGPDSITSPSGSFSVASAAKKISNGGIALDGGVIEWKVNGSVVHSNPFANGSNVANRTYTFTGVAPGDNLEVIITEG